MQPGEWMALGIGVAFAIGHRPIGAFMFRVLAYMNGTAQRNPVWGRDNAVLRPVVQWFLLVAGVYLIAAIMLDHFGVVSLGPR